MGVAKKIIEGGLKAVAKKAPRMSEALNPHIGKRLYITQADRTALDYDQGLLGGPGFVELAKIDPAKYKDAAWAVNKQQTASTLVNAMAQNPEEAIWTNLIGSPTQHRSNQIVFDRIMNQFNKAVQEDRLTPELRKTINNRLANMKDDKTGTYFFPKNVDILSPDFAEHAQTFDNRAMIASILSGEGIKKDMKALYKQPGTIVDTYGDIIRDTSDPLLVDANTHDIGNRLFSLSGNIEENADLHPAFPFILKGRKESEAFTPAPKEIVLENYVNKYMKENKGKKPGTFALTRGYPPSVEVDEPLVERLFKSGYAGGGFAKKFGKKMAEKLAKDIELPPAENSARTQIVGTLPTYEKARDILGKEGIKGADIIDFGAGKGLGSTSMKADSFEPYPQGWYPTYTKSEDIPSEKYKGLLNLNVLNVLDPEMRAHTVKEIGRVMQPEGGTGLITTRGRDVMNTIGGKAGNEPMSVITSRDTYQKGFEPNELREYIKYILGGDFEYEPLNLGPAGVKIKKKAEGGSIDEPEVLKEIPRGKISGKIADILKPASEFLGKYEVLPQIPLLGGTSVAELTGVEGIQTLADDISRGYRPIRNLERGKLQTSFFDPRLVDAVDLGTTALGGVGLAKNLGKTAIKEGMKQIETGTGMLGRNVMNPRMNVIKDQGGMLVGGEKALDDELIAMKRNESAYPHAQAHYVVGDKDPNAVALNQWVDTKVRKYLRNQAGTEADPILKTIESGVEHNFQPTMGDTKYSVRNKRLQVGKPEAGIANTELGKEFEYKIDSMFEPKSSKDIKEILNSPMEFADPATAKRRKASLLRVEQDLPISDEKDLDALMLINQIPDKNVYTLSGTNITERLGLNHVSDVLMEDLQTGKLRPEQLNQMSIEKAIRRAAEYDAEKTKAMAKANASSVEGMPIPKAYDDGYKWVELKHDTDPKRTEKALKSEGEMMGHCVGGYCPNVESGEIKIFSLRGPDGKSHVTIEARPQFSMTLWRNANLDAINSNPKLKQYDFNMNSLDNDHKYGYRMTERDYVTEMTKEMKKLGINPVEPPSYMELHQVKGKQNKRPDDKYQNYISDFIKNNPTKHEIVLVEELHNTNLMNVQDVVDDGIVSKTLHNNPEIDKILKIKHADEYRPDMPNIPKSFSRTEELRYDLFKEAATDLARQNKYFIDKDDILNHLREKYLTPPKKAKGGSIDLQQEYKLENMRRRYG